MPEAQARVPDHHGHQPGYLTGASAEAAAQKLIDGGLLADILPPKEEPKQEAPEAVEAREPVAEQEQASEQPAEEQSEGFSNLEEYLTKSQLDRESFFKLPVKAKVDGKELEVPLAKLVESYQIGEHLSQKLSAHAEERRAWDAERTAARTELQQNLTLAQQLGQLAQQELMREYADVTPADPARYLEAQQRLGAIQNWLAQTQQARTQVNAQALAAEQAALLDAIPEWRDPPKFQEASKKIAEYAARQGLAPAELSNITNHVHLKILRDASRAAELQAENDTLRQQLSGKQAATLKLVRTAPAMASPGARTQTNPTTARLQQARQVMTSGKMRGLDAQAAVAQALIDAGAA